MLILLQARVQLTQIVGGVRGKRARGLATETPSVSSEKTRVPALPLSLSDCMTLGSLASQRSQDNEGA